MHRTSAYGRLPVHFMVTSGRESNVNIPGVWLFKIGNMYGSNIESPQMSGGRRALAADLVLLSILYNLGII